MSHHPDLYKLSRLNIFRDLDQKEIETISKHIFEKKIEKDTIIFSEGMPGEVLYVIVSGSVEIIKKMDGDKEKILGTMSANDIVGEMSLIDSKPRSATGRTCEDSVLMAITRRNFDEILDSDPRIAAKILRSMLKIVSGRLRVS